MFRWVSDEMYIGAQRARGLGQYRQWKKYSEQVSQIRGNGRYQIWLREEAGGVPPAGLGSWLGAPVNTAGLVSTGSAIATTSAIPSLLPELTSWAGPIGAGVGALVGIIAGLWAAHNQRVKGAKEENQIVGSAVSTWDGGMQAIFAAANSGQITGAQGAQLVGQLLSSYWSAVGQAKGLPGVADNSGSGSNCGSYTSGVTTPCSPGHPCTKSCTAGCCVGCNDLWTSSLDAIAVLNNPNGGTFSTCTVYSSSFGLAQRPGYSLTFTPPPAATAAGNTLASAVGLSTTDTVAGIPVWILALGGAAALAFYVL